MKRECKALKREQNIEKGETKTEEKDVTAVAADADVIIVSDGCVNLAYEDSNWVIDSGASFHITPYGGFFTSYTSDDFGCVRMENDGLSKIVGMGSVCLETNTGCKLLLKDVRHVPDIRLNLISTGKLDDEGYSNHFGEGKWKLTKGSLLIARGKKNNTLYMMQAKLKKGEVNTIDDDFSTKLWHKRLGHMSEKGLQILAKKELLPNTKGVSLKTCVDCLAGKQHRVAFHRTPISRKINILDLIHSDVCMMDSRTLGGALYFVIFIDDHSRKV